jgi:polysaccharide deacetylase 2 family uncharacterized protein YibQ
VVGIAIAAGAGTLELLGPPPHPATEPAEVTPTVPSTPRPSDAPPIAPEHDASATPAPSRSGDPAPSATQAVDAPGAAAIHAPDPALLEIAPDYAPAMLPRIGADGRKPMDFYAAPFGRAEKRPRIALMLGGIGQSESDSEDAIAVLPAGITFVVSPYALHPERLLGDIRAHGHEMLIGLPMEPFNNPVNSEGSFQLMTGAIPEQNARNLEWSLSRIQGYAGVTNAMDGLRGERFSAASQQMAPVLQEIAKRGLYYVDAIPGTSRLPLASVTALVTGGVDVQLDEPAVRSEIDIRLKQLEQTARDHGVAIGLAGLPRPVTLSRLAAWTAGLDSRGFALAPVSAVMRTAVANQPTATDQPRQTR